MGYLHDTPQHQSKSPRDKSTPSPDESTTQETGSNADLVAQMATAPLPIDDPSVLPPILAAFQPGMSERDLGGVELIEGEASWGQESTAQGFDSTSGRRATFTETDKRTVSWADGAATRERGSSTTRATEVDAEAVRKATVESQEGLESRRAALEQDIRDLHADHPDFGARQAELMAAERAMARFKDIEERAKKGEITDLDAAQMGVAPKQATASDTKKDKVTLETMERTRTVKKEDGSGTASTATLDLSSGIGAGASQTDTDAAGNSETTAASGRLEVDDQGRVIGQSGALATSTKDKDGNESKTTTRVKQTDTEIAAGRTRSGTRAINDSYKVTHSLSGDLGVTLDIKKLGEDRYAVVSSVQLKIGGSLGGSRDLPKGDSGKKGSASLTASASAGATLTYQRELTAEELQTYERALERGSGGEPEFQLIDRLRALGQEIGPQDVGSVLGAGFPSEGEKVSFNGAIEGSLALKAGLGGHGLSGSISGKGSRDVVATGEAAGTVVRVTIGASVSMKADGTAQIHAVTVGGGGGSKEEEKVSVTSKPLRQSDSGAVAAYRALVGAWSYDSLATAAAQHSDYVERSDFTESEELAQRFKLGVTGASVTLEDTAIRETRVVSTEAGAVGSRATGGREQSLGSELAVIELDAFEHVSSGTASIEEDGLSLDLTSKLQHLTPRARFPSWTTLASEGLPAALREAFIDTYTRLKSLKVSPEDMDVIVAVRAHDVVNWERCLRQPRVQLPWRALRRVLVNPSPHPKVDKDFPDQALNLTRAEAIADFMSSEGEWGRQTWVRALRQWGEDPSGYHAGMGVERLGEATEWPSSMRKEQAAYEGLQQEIKSLPSTLAGLDDRFGIQGEQHCLELLTRAERLRTALLGSEHIALESLRSEKVGRVTTWQTYIADQVDQYTQDSKMECDPEGLDYSLTRSHDPDFKVRAAQEISRRLELLSSNKKAEEKIFGQIGQTYSYLLFSRDRIHENALNEDIKALYQLWREQILATREWLTHAGIPEEHWMISSGPSDEQSPLFEPDGQGFESMVETLINGQWNLEARRVVNHYQSRY